MKDNIFKRFGSFLGKNKKLSILVGVGILVVCAIVATLIFVLNNDTPTPEPTPPAPVGGAEVGEYYYDVAGGEVLLTLQSDMKFTLEGPDVNKSGSYTVSGNDITLDFVRDEDGTATAKLDSDKLTVTMDGATLTFLKKVKFTLTFNDSDLAPIEVVNGKTAAEPAAPSKDGYVFIGWYVNDEYKKLFDFETTTITENVTVYARWAKTTVGYTEYVISIDLGYGDEEVSYIDTVSGKAYIPEEPVREGYTFCGWYVSMYENGEKLSYAYTEDMVFDANTTLFAVWSDDSATKLTTPNVTIAANAIKWNSVKGAINYTVKITDATGAIIKEETSGKNDFAFDFAALAAGEYVIYVTANASDASKSSDTCERYFINKALTRVSKFEVVNGVLTFNTVANAEKYYITVVCGDKSHDHTNYDLGTTARYDFSNCLMTTDGIKFVVTASAEGYANSVSTEFVYVLDLPKVENLVYDAATDSFTWNAVENATKYEVTIVVGGQTYVFDNVTTNSFSVSAYTGEIAISVVPKNTLYNSPEAATANCKKEVPTTPTGLTFDNMTLTWNAAEGAVSYVVKINGQTYEVTGTSFSFETLQLVAGTTYDASVQAVNAAGASGFSESISIGYLTSTFSLSYANNTVTWTSVIGASTFEVRVNGGEVTTVTGANSAKIVLTKSGDNLIEVRYTDGNGSSWVSLTVKAYTITYNTHSLDGGEKVEYLATGDTMTPPTEGFTNKGYEFVAWYTALESGKEYGTLFTGEADLTLHAIWNAKSFDLNLMVDNLGITNIKPGDKVSVKYDSMFTLPIPVSTDPERSVFVGWFDGPTLNATKITDEKGNSLEVSKFATSTNVYPVFATGVLNYELKEDGTYSVTAGPNFDKISHVYIPATYNGKPVTSILENAFQSRKQLVTIQIPNSIELIGSGAFTGNTKLEAIEVYEVEGNHEVFYSSHDGALIRNYMGTVTLEVFPRAKTGTFKTPDGVTTIRNKVFQYSNISKVIISKDVTAIYERAFYDCKLLTTLEFEGGREQDVVLMCGTESEPDSIFYSTRNIKNIIFPAKLADFNYTHVLNQLTVLERIDVEEGGNVYSSVDGMLTNADQDTIIYAPLAVSGDYTIPQGIVSIAEKAFYGRTYLTSVTVPNYVENVGTRAFYGCSGVKYVKFLGNRLFDLSIGQYAFGSIAALETVEFLGSGSTTALDAGTVTIGSSAFSPASAPALKTVVFGNGVNVAEIGSSAFSGQTKLTTLTLEPNISIISIGGSAFKGIKITTLDIPKTVTNIGASAFQSCNELESVTFNEGSNGNITFGSSAFADCAKIVSVYLPSTVEGFDGSVFNGCASLMRIEVAANNPYLNSDANGILYNEAYSTLLYYPRGLKVDQTTLNSLPWDKITTIGSAAFSGHKTLASFEIKKGVTEIAANAFKGCTALTTLTYEAGGSGITLTIGNGAFEGCSALTSATLPAYTVSIGNTAFQSSKFQSFVIPESVTRIGTDAFKGNTALTSINIPAKVTAIGAGAFSGCTKLATVEIDNSANAAKFTFENASSNVKGTFYNCDALTKINFQNRATNIGAYMFYDADKLSSVTFGSNVTTIGRNAFYSCAKLVSVIIPDNVTTIGDYTFQESALNNIEIGKGVTTIGSYAFSKTKLITITIPNNVVGINLYAFQGCSSLKSIIFEAGTTGLAIGEGAFQECTSLETINFPARLINSHKDIDVNSYKTYAMVSNISKMFYGCTNLKSINVAEGGKHYYSLDGVLYAATDGVPTTLLYCPPKNAGRIEGGVATLVIPKTVTLVENRSLLNLQVIKTIKFEEFDTSDPNYGKQLLHFGRGTTSSVEKGIATSATVLGGVTYDFTSNLIGTQTTNCSVTRIEFPSHLSTIGGYAIGGTTNDLTFVINPDASEITICKYAFNNSKIRTFNFPGVKAIGQNSFTQLYNNQTITITFGDKSTLTSIPSHAFNGLRAETFCIPASVVTLENQAFYYAKIKSITFAEGSKLETIGNSAFDQCAYLASIDFSNVTKLKSIGNYAFGRTQITSFAFPETVTEVGAKIFEGCWALESIHFSATFTPEMLFNSDNSGVIHSIFTDLDGNIPPANGLGLGGTPTYSRFKTITVDSDNPYLKVVNGVLYDSTESTLYCFPSQLTSALSNGTYVIPSTVSRIESSAFQFFPGTSIIIPDSVAYIGNGAFKESAKLVNVKIGKGVATMGDEVFKSCTALKNVEFALDGVLTSIGSSLFQGNTKLETVTNIPDSVRTMGSLAFNQCESLKSIILPAGLQEIPAQFFQTCSSLTSVTVQENVSSIGRMAFMYTYRLTEIYIPSSVQVIGEKAFFVNATGASSITNLTKVEIGANSHLDEIGKQAFENCTKLESINLPASLTTIYGGASSGSVVNPSATGGVFKNCISLKSISIPGLKIVPDSLFEGCVNLETVVLGEGIESIGSMAFYNNTSLKSITIPSTVTSIGVSAFENCTSLETLTFAEGNAMTVLGTAADANDNIFKNTVSLDKVILPTTITLIGGHVFDNSGIASVNLEEMTELKTIGNYAFNNCDNLTKVVVLTNVVTLGNFAFYDCDNVTVASVTFGLEYFGELAFGSCDLLTDGYIPSSVMSLNGNPYAGCPLIPSVRIDDDNNFFTRDAIGSIYSMDMTTLHYYSTTDTSESAILAMQLTTIAPGAFSGAKFKTVTLPATIEEIAPFAFFVCENLETITIPVSVSEIGDYAFYGCKKLNNVTIPAYATTLGDYVFANCTTLSNVSFASTTSTYSIGTHFFENCISITQVILPKKHTITIEDATANGDRKFYSVSNKVNTLNTLATQVIPSYMFAGTGIVNAVIPSDILYIETNGVFMNCSKLETVTFTAPTLKYSYIGNYMFYNCDSLVEIEIPYGDTKNPLANTVGYSFAECDNLETIILYLNSKHGQGNGDFAIADDVINNEGMFMNCKKLKNLIIYDVASPSNAGDNGGSDDSEEDDGGASEEGGGSIVTPGGGSVVTPGGGSVVTPGGGSVVTPGGNGGSEDAGDSEDNGGIGEAPGDEEVVTPPGGSSIVTPGGNFGAADGNEVEIPGGIIGTLQGAFGSLGTADSEDAGEAEGEEEVVTPGGSSIVTPGGSGGSIVTPGAGEEAEDGGATTPGGGSVVTPGGGSVVTPGGGSVVTPGGGSVVTPGAGEEDVEDGGSTPDDSEDSGNGTTYNQTYLDYIGNKYFQGCESLESITVMPDSYIGDSAFEGCTNLKEFNFYYSEENEDDVTPPAGGDSEDDGGASEEGGGSIVTPGGGSVVTPGGGSVVTPGGNGGSVVTPGGNGGSEDAGDSDDNGGVGEAPGDEEVVTPPGGSSIVTPGGNFGAADGNEVEIPGGIIGALQGAFGSLGTADSEDAGEAEGEEEVVTPGGSSIGGIGSSTGGGTTVTPGAGEEAEDGGATTPGGSIVTPGGGSVVTPGGGSVVTPGGGSVVTPGAGEDDGEDVPAEDEKTVPNLEYLGTNAFKGCTSLTNITLPGLPAKTGTNAFEGWTADQTITLSNSEEEIEELIENGLFDGCDAKIVDKDGKEINPED